MPAIARLPRIWQEKSNVALAKMRPVCTLSSVQKTVLYWLYATDTPAWVQQEVRTNVT